MSTIRVVQQMFPFLICCLLIFELRVFKQPAHKITTDLQRTTGVGPIGETVRGVADAVDMNETYHVTLFTKLRVNARPLYVVCCVHTIGLF